MNIIINIIYYFFNLNFENFNLIISLLLNIKIIIKLYFYRICIFKYYYLFN